MSPTRDLDPAVLGPAAFGDVHLGQNLDAREQGPQQPAGGAVALDQHAVDAVADADPVLERLDVDVRGPQLNRLGNQQLHQPDDRGAGFVDDFVAGGRFLLGFGEVDRRVGEFLQHRVGALVLHLAVMPVDGLQDAFPRGQGDFDLAIQNEPQFLERIEIVRVADDHPQRAVLLGHRQNGIFAGDRFGHQFDDRGRNDDFAQIDVVEAMLLRPRPA